MPETGIRRWDNQIDPTTLPKIRARRIKPDGEYHHIVMENRLGKKIIRYPFELMKEGDWFLIPTEGRSINAAKTYMRQQGGRLDLELAIADHWAGERYVRVTLVLRGVNAMKKAIGMAVFDTARRDKYLRDKKREYRGAPPVATPPLPSKPEISEPSEPIALKEPTTDANKDFREMLAQQRREAKRELAGIDKDDPDFMGVEDED